MNKFMRIFELFLSLWHVFFPPKKSIVSKKDENIKVMKVALDSAEQTEEVINAKKKVAYIETLSEKDREAKEDDLIEVQKIIEKTGTKPITEKRAKSLIERYKERKDND